MLHHAFTALLPTFMPARTTPRKTSSSYRMASLHHAKKVAWQAYTAPAQ